nr:hypothetical protein Iba_chr06cCG12170 [Ipomoea batatas]
MVAAVVGELTRRWSAAVKMVMAFCMLVVVDGDGDGVVRIPIPASASDQSHTQSDIPVAGQSDSHVANTPGSSQTPSNSVSPQEPPAVASPQDSVHPQPVISTESSSQSVAPQEPPAVASPQDSIHPQPIISTESSSQSVAPQEPPAVSQVQHPSSRPTRICRPNPNVFPKTKHKLKIIEFLCWSTTISFAQTTGELVSPMILRLHRLEILGKARGKESKITLLGRGPWVELDEHPVNSGDKHRHEPEAIDLL